jgi:hypothetical protein
VEALNGIVGHRLVKFLPGHLGIFHDAHRKNRPREGRSYTTNSALTVKHCYAATSTIVAHVSCCPVPVVNGKTPAARRTLPLTLRVRRMLEARWDLAGRPDEGFIWTSLTKSGHIEASTIRPFVLYTLRHTFLTRLGESGCDVWTLARIAGHSSIAISSRYIHPSGDAGPQCPLTDGRAEKAPVRAFSSGHATLLATSGSGDDSEMPQLIEEMVRPERFELPAFWFVARRSIQLS